VSLYGVLETTALHMNMLGAFHTTCQYSVVDNVMVMTAPELNQLLFQFINGYNLQTRSCVVAYM